MEKPSTNGRDEKCKYGKSKYKCAEAESASTDKTAELSQRRPRDASNIWVPSKFLSPHSAPSYLSGNL